MKSLPILATISISLALAVSLSAEAMKLGNIRAFQVKGTVTWLDHDGRDMGQLKRGQKLYEGSQIFTQKDSSAMLMFTNGAVIQLLDDTEIDITRFQQVPYDRHLGSYLTLQKDPSKSVTLITLNKGTIEGIARKLQLDSKYDIATPIGTAGVRNNMSVLSTSTIKYSVSYLQNKNGTYRMNVRNLKRNALLNRTYFYPNIKKGPRR